MPNKMLIAPYTYSKCETIVELFEISLDRHPQDGISTSLQNKKKYTNITHWNNLSRISSFVTRNINYLIVFQ